MMTIDAVEAAFLLGAAVEGQYYFDGGVTLEVRRDALFYFKAARLHREDGPAVVYQNGATEWWIHGEEVEQRT
jgi:hypothetical protein